MIRTGRLYEFVRHFIQTHNEEVRAKNRDREDQVKWEFWLHRCHHLSYTEFLKQTSGEGGAATPERPSDSELLDMIKANRKTMDGFSPT